MNEERINLRDELRRLRKKAELNRHCHSVLADEHGRRERLVSTGVVVGSAFSAMTILANWGEVAATAGIPESLLHVAAFALSSGVFIAELVSRHLDWSRAARAHTAAVDVWGAWIRETKEFEKTDLGTCAESDARKRSKELHGSYRLAMKTTPQIPNGRLLELKAQLLRKIWISSQLERNTGETVEQLGARFHSEDRRNRQLEKTDASLPKHVADHATTDKERSQ